MEVLLANEYGFCFGVERAVEMVEDALQVGAPVRTLGPLIHNTQEMQRLECEGVSTVQDPAEVRPRGSDRRRYRWSDTSYQFDLVSAVGPEPFL